MLENVAFLHLCRGSRDIYYHQASRECDFLEVEGGRVAEALQICQTVTQPKTREREIQGLLEAMKAHTLKTGLILTDDDHEEVPVFGGKILILPLWYHLLKKR